MRKVDIRVLSWIPRYLVGESVHCVIDLIRGIVQVIFRVSIHADNVVAEFVEDGKTGGRVAIEVRTAVVSWDEAENTLERVLVGGDFGPLRIVGERGKREVCPPVITNLMAFVVGAADHVCPNRVGDGGAAAEASDKERGFYIEGGENIEELRSPF